jgi:cytoskeletal protein RodZ
MPFTDFPGKISNQNYLKQTAGHSSVATHVEPQKSRKNKLKFKKLYIVLGVVIMSLVLVFFVYGYFNTRNQLMSIKNSSSSKSPGETQQLIDKVGKLVELPAGETPTLATVNNAAQLKKQQFFAMAKDGDKLLIYSKSGLGVLYRPSTNKVIAYSPINLSNK